MGQKVNPVAVRLYLNRYFNSSWFSDYYYTQLLSEDYFLRDYFQKIHSSKRIGRCIIHRYSKKVILHIFYLLPNYRSFGSHGTVNGKRVKNIPSSHLALDKPCLKGLLRRPEGELVRTWGNASPGANVVARSGATKEHSHLFLRQTYRHSVSKERSGATTLAPQINEAFLKIYLAIGSVLQPFKLSLQKQIAHRWLNAPDKNYAKSEVRRRSKQSWINLHWFILRYLFLQKYFASRHYVRTFLRCVATAANPMSGRCDEGIFLENDKIFAAGHFFSFVEPLRSRLLVPSLKTFQSNKINTIYISDELNVRSLQDIGNALTKKRFSKNIPLHGKLVGLVSPALHFLSLETSNYVYCVPVRSTSIFQSASLLAEEICLQFIQKQSFAKIWKNISRSLNRQKPKIIKGVRISCSGRLNGVEIAKKENRQWGETSLHVFQNKIDYAMQHALSPYGILGIKVWISYSE